MNDSTVYLSSIQQIPDAELQKGTGFLIGRDIYSSQFKYFLESRFAGKETSTVFFDTNKESIEKTYIKVRRLQKRKENSTLIEIPQEKFTLQTINKNMEK